MTRKGVEEYLYLLRNSWPRAVSPSAYMDTATTICLLPASAPRAPPPQGQPPPQARPDLGATWSRTWRSGAGAEGQGFCKLRRHWPGNLQLWLNTGCPLEGQTGWGQGGLGSVFRLFLGFPHPYLGLTLASTSTLHPGAWGKDQTGRGVRWELPPATCLLLTCPGTHQQRWPRWTG